MNYSSVVSMEIDSFCFVLFDVVLRPAQQAGFPKARYGEKMRKETQESREK